MCVESTPEPAGKMPGPCKSKLGNSTESSVSDPSIDVADPKEVESYANELTVVKKKPTMKVV